MAKREKFLETRSPEKQCAQLRGEELGAIALVALGVGREADTRDGIFG